jgi:chromate transporter
MILAFVGFMAGFNMVGGSILNGTIALIATTYFTFLPCFLFIFIGAPIIEKTQENIKLKSILNIVTASVVGVVLNLSVYFGKSVIFPTIFSINNIDWSSLIWLIISIVVLYKFKIEMTTWIGISAIYGFVHHFILKF